MTKWMSFSVTVMLVVETNATLLNPDLTSIVCVVFRKTSLPASFLYTINVFSSITVVATARLSTVCVCYHELIEDARIRPRKSIMDLFFEERKLWNE